MVFKITKLVFFRGDLFFNFLDDIVRNLRVCLIDG